MGGVIAGRISGMQQVPATTAPAHSPAAGNVPAERLVGAWRADVAIGPCNLAKPVAFFSAYNTFHSGGTLSDINWVPPATRGPAHGVWRHLGGRQYEARFEFFRYDNPQPSQASGRQEARTQMMRSVIALSTARVRSRVPSLSRMSDT
jgi:hypothetical protein